MSRTSPKDSTVVSIQILARSYQVRCKQAEVKELQKAASYLDDRMKKARETGKSSSLERTAIMVALNIANELLKEKAVVGDGNIGQALKSMNSRIGKVLDQHGGEQLELE